MSSVSPGMVSVIIPVFNRPRQLVEAVASALGQDYRPLEILIIDDGSTDGVTADAAAALAERHAGVVSVVRVANGGPGRAREAGRVRARGEFIQYLDSDDVLLPGKFKAQVASLAADKGANVSYGITRHRKVDGSLDPGPHKGTGRRREHMFPDFLLERWWDTSTPLYRASVCAAIGPWTDLRLEEDWEYDCRIAAQGGTLAYCDVEVSETRDHDENRLSRQKSESDLAAALSARERARRLIWAHARNAGLPDSHPAVVRTFARSAFLLARQCGAMGLVDESRRLLDLAIEAADSAFGPDRDLKVYRSLADFLGAQCVAMISERLDAWRASFRGHVGR